MSSEVAGVNRSQQHAIVVETTIEVWVPRRILPPMPYIRPSCDMINFSIIFGLFPVKYAKFIRDDYLRNVFEVNRTLNYQSRLALNFAQDTSHGCRLPEDTRTILTPDRRSANRLSDRLEDAYREDRESVEEWW